jgi:hypothetical protein
MEPRHACSGTRISCLRYRKRSAGSRRERRRCCLQPLQTHWTRGCGGRSDASFRSQYTFKCHYWTVDADKRHMDRGVTEQGRMACRREAWNIRQRADAPGFVSLSRIEIPMGSKKGRKRERKQEPESRRRPGVETGRNLHSKLVGVSVAAGGGWSLPSFAPEPIPIPILPALRLDPLTHIIVSNKPRISARLG